MWIQIPHKNSTAILEHRFNSCVYRMYWKEYGANLIMCLGVPY